MPQRRELGRNRLDKRCRSADVHAWTLVRRPGHLGQHRAVDSSPEPVPRGRWFARDRVRHLQGWIPIRQSFELGAVDDLVPSAGGVQKSHRHRVAGAVVGGERIPAATLVWGAGVVASPAAK